MAGEVLAAGVDIDASGTLREHDDASDGLMVMRFLFGYQRKPITNGATSAMPGRTPAQMFAYLANILLLLDVHGHGSARATSDGLLIVRYMLGLRGAARRCWRARPSGLPLRLRLKRLSDG